VDGVAVTIFGRRATLRLAAPSHRKWMEKEIGAVYALIATGKKCIFPHGP
jgi:hypothetical protein